MANRSKTPWRPHLAVARGSVFAAPNADAKKNAVKVSFPKGTIVPGFVNPHSSLGIGQHLSEKIDTFTPELAASDAFDPFAPAIQQSARAGITAVGRWSG